MFHELPDSDMNLASEPTQVGKDGDAMDAVLAPLSTIAPAIPQWVDQIIPPGASESQGQADWGDLNSSMDTRRDGSEEGKGAKCVACLENAGTNDLVTIKCGCDYCKGCFNDYFETGLANRSSFPPKCCGQAISFDTYQLYLRNTVVNKYMDVQEEFSSKNPTYCADPTCSAFLPGAVDFATFKACPRCHRQTCIRCKNFQTIHEWSDEVDTLEGRRCPEAMVPSELQNLIEKEEWNRCPGCRHVVEKTEGCDYMECICGENFCYKCGNAFDVDDFCGCSDNAPDGEDGGDTGEDEDLEEGEEWPRYAAAVDLHGRVRCMHLLTSPLDEDGDENGDNGRCHGCLREMPGIRSCDTCHLELCSECLP